MSYAVGIKEFVDTVNAALPPDYYTYPVERQRELYDSLTEALPIPVRDAVTWRDVTAEHEGRSVRLRIYEPATTSGPGVVFYVRGGGFVIGSLHSHHSLVAEIADRTGLVTIAIDFGMAPENPAPGPVEDCYAGVSAVLADPAAFGLDIDPAAAVVAGESSGANMAVVLSMLARDRGGPVLRGQALISPVLDFTRWRHGGEDAPLLSGGEMEYFVACYCPEVDQAADQYVSPLLGGKFHALPPAYVVGCEKDSLRVDAEKYVELLEQNDTPVRYVLEAGMVHAPVRARGVSEPAADMVRRFCAAVVTLAEGKDITITDSTVAGSTVATSTDAGSTVADAEAAGV
ncbi:alpha/beta hydrolase [Actinokineospora globicatena]|uniref:alpha/beta hydrolase n=1 Tax=Actinokineospora globicatena TaxID=103729 RepID=UPI0020A4FCBA|nr:alpha/beta hydrolase [Actinokineospora globicatena]MCP2305886.1 acetyl esterase [Actinokineospora globicatena]GLW80245.1 carboxylesterase [Actinokineospora globicatena]GLW87074.1 carboxylesterase [Actinokineospora globicatena]